MNKYECPKCHSTNLLMNVPTWCRLDGETGRNLGEADFDPNEVEDADLVECEECQH